MSLPTHWLAALTELTVFVARDGTVLEFFGGRGIGDLELAADRVGQRLADAWPEPASTLVPKLLRRAFAKRGSIESELDCGDGRYELRVCAQAPDRAVCIVRRLALPSVLGGQPRGTEVSRTFDRRGFFRRFRESLATAALNERPLAAAAIHLDGLVEIGRALDAQVMESVRRAALENVMTCVHSDAGEPTWYIGQLDETSLIAVLDTSNRECLERCLEQICDALAAPVRIGDATFQLRPTAGVAILGQDAIAPAALLDHARTTSIESRRAGACRILFFSDTMKLRSLARLDVTRELREAIDNGDIELRYRPRHDLRSGQLTAMVGYLRWQHPLRGEVRPAEFLAIAESTGLAMPLSRSVLERLRQDFATFASTLDPRICISFGALRHHVLKKTFLSDVFRLLEAGDIPPERLELRIAERAYVGAESESLRKLAGAGVRLVVDEFGRSVSSLDQLARVPLWGMQLDRSWVVKLSSDRDAQRVCAAAIAVAKALGIKSIATGIDDQTCRDELNRLGCEQGSGDLFNNPSAAAAAASG